MMRQTAAAKRRDGVAAVEAAIILPLILLLVVNIWDVSRLVEVSQILNNACREGGRMAAAGQMDAATVQSRIISYLNRAGITTTGVTPVITNLTDAARADPTDALQLDEFNITVTLPMANVRFIMLSAFMSDGSLVGQANFFSMKDIPVSVSATIPVE